MMPIVEQTLYDTIQEQDKVQARLARRLNPPLTPVEFWQMMTGYRGRRFSDSHRRQLAVLLDKPVEKLFPESESIAQEVGEA